MAEIIVVTNRKLCKENFLERLKKIFRAPPSALILREKDLSKEDYLSLCEEVMKIKTCKVIVHSVLEAAERFRAPLHLPIDRLREAEGKNLTLGASCHKIEDLKFTKNCSYLTLGNIFQTDCKPNKEGVGVSFLRDFVSKTPLPVFAIGGISKENLKEVLLSGARGACVMSGAMTSSNVERYLNELYEIEAN